MNKDALIEAKNRVESILKALKKLQKQFKPNKDMPKSEKIKYKKKQKEAISLMEDFLKCNITSSSITEKYNKIVNMLAEYTHVEK